MLPKAHLTSHSRWLALGEWTQHRDYLGHEDFFLYSSSVYSCHLFLISSASIRSLPFLSFIEPIFAWNIPLVCLFSWRDLYSFPFCCFPLFLCIDRWRRLSYLSLLFFGTLHSDAYIFPFLLCLSILFFSAKAFDCVDHNKLWKILKEMGIPNHLICLLRNLYAGH